MEQNPFLLSSRTLNPCSLITTLLHTKAHRSTEVWELSKSTNQVCWPYFKRYIAIFESKNLSGAFNDETHATLHSTALQNTGSLDRFWDVVFKVKKISTFRNKYYNQPLANCKGWGIHVPFSWETFVKLKIVFLKVNRLMSRWSFQKSCLLTLLGMKVF